MTTPLLQARGIRKAFPGVLALDDVDFTLAPGEVHALLGENGAGKSTLTRIIAGDYEADAGSLAFSGEPRRLRSPRDARELGVRLVTQERALVGSLTVTENILLGDLPRRRGRIDWRGARALASEAMARAGLQVDPSALAERLRPAEQQLLEIAKALASRSRILILDEPTAALAAADTDHLFGVMRRLRDDGVGIIYISHRVGELSAVVDHVTVLRDGRLVSSAPLADTSAPELVEMMVGRPLSDMFPRTRTAAGGELLELLEVTSPGVCTDVSLEVRRGEVAMVFGLIGSGATELPYVAAGHLPHAGSVRVHGRVGFVPVDRKEEGIVGQATIRRNIGLVSLARYRRRGTFSRALERRAAAEQITALDLRPSDPERGIGNLSGGNQQKAVLARWLAAGADLLLFSEPTRGVDVGARAEIYELVGRLCESGAGVLAASSDLDEVVGLADRVYVMTRGRVVAHLSGPEITHSAVLAAATR